MPPSLPAFLASCLLPLDGGGPLAGIVTALAAFAAPSEAGRALVAAQREGALEASGLKKVYVPASVLASETAAPSSAELRRARKQAETATAALDALASRVFVRKQRRTPLVVANAEPAPPAPVPPIDEVLRARARRALRRGGFIPAGSSR